jgi:hypothetical protein
MLRVSALLERAEAEAEREGIELVEWIRRSVARSSHHEMEG